MDDYVIKGLRRSQPQRFRWPSAWEICIRGGGAHERTIHVSTYSHGRRRIAPQLLRRIKYGKCAQALRKPDHKIGSKHAVGINAIPQESGWSEPHRVGPLNRESLSCRQKLCRQSVRRQGYGKGRMDDGIFEIKQDGLSSSL